MEPFIRPQNRFRAVTNDKRALFVCGEAVSKPERNRSCGRQEAWCRQLSSWAMNFGQTADRHGRTTQRCHTHTYTHTHTLISREYLWLEAQRRSGSRCATHRPATHSVRTATLIGKSSAKFLINLGESRSHSRGVCSGRLLEVGGCRV